MSSGFVSGGTLDAPIERDAEWLEAQAAIEAERRRKAELATQNDGKSLFEVLQANKEAKQEAFEEAARLKNQYRALDEDEAGFLAEILGKEKKIEVEWKGIGRKRKGAGEGLLKGVKIRRVDGAVRDKNEKEGQAKKPEGDAKAAHAEKTKPTEPPKPVSAPPPKPVSNALALGLGYGSSDEDD
ncbi:hypothetical protein DM02DRAFT_55410 [Periconia macrospinosa]|uniref:FAM192A/Fyv6 N-terminal domain-containing protein n=1 Tax=Periconia macrospinosa TaxID=97972 RepID=A0A2V1E5T8_9PLEO|nr:hypothetical protein DM02DRAFT_55410 [Periconia macrospinosa]